MKRKTCIFKNVAMLFIAIGLLAVFVGCNDKNDEVGPLRQEVQALRSDLTKSFEGKVDAKTDELQKQVDDLKARLTELSNKKTGVSAEELESVKKQIVEVTVAKTAFEEYKESVKAKIENAANVADLNALKGKIESVEPRVAALETLVGSNKAALDKALEDLGKEVKGLNTQISDLKSKIESNKSDLVSMLNEYKRIAKENSDANAANIKTLNDKLADLEKKMNVGVVNAMLNSRLTSLVVIPDYVSDNGGALPVVKFSPIETDCGIYTPEGDVILQYRLSPSTVTEGDIDKNGLKFIYNSPKVISAKNKTPGTLEVKAKFNKIENGVLFVSATPDDLGKAYYGKDDNTENRIDQIMLEVPSSKDGNYKVHSDWVRVIYDKEAKKPFLVKHEGRDPLTKAFELAKDINAAKAQVYGTDKRIVELAWNETKDLEKVVEAVLGTRAMPRETYGFDKQFTFAITGKYFVGSNATDQQEFLKLDGSSVSTRVYSVNDPNKEGYNKASIGREPIVAVSLKRGGNDCLLGFLKLKIVKEKPEVVNPVVYNEEFDAGSFATPGCEEQKKTVVNTQMMNERFYAKYKMSKEAFHNEFTLYDVNGGVGTIAVDDESGDKTSYNLTYTLTEEELWANAGSEVKKTVEFRNAADKSAATKTIRVTFKAKVPQIETVTISDNLVVSNYWYNGYKAIKQNVRVPDKGDSDKNKATFSNNINNAFVSKNKLLDWKKAGYTYEYKFDENNQLPGVTVKPGSDGKVLLYNRQEMATIERVDGEGDMLTYAQTDAALYLLNKSPESARARVVLVVKNACGKEVNVKIEKLAYKDRFDVIFLRPINADPETNDNFKDGVDLGNPHSFLDVKSLVRLSDWRRNVVTPTSDKFDFLPNNQNYYDYYGVSDIRIDTSKPIKVTDLDGYSTLPATIDVKQTPKGTGYDEAPDARYEYGTITYKNNGNNLDKPFILHVPVKVSYKWGVFDAVVDINVEATKKAGSRKRVK